VGSIIGQVKGVWEFKSSAKLYETWGTWESINPNVFPRHSLTILRDCSGAHEAFFALIVVHNSHRMLLHYILPKKQGEHSIFPRTHDHIVLIDFSHRQTIECIELSLFACYTLQLWIKVNIYHRRLRLRTNISLLIYELQSQNLYQSISYSSYYILFSLVCMGVHWLKEPKTISAIIKFSSYQFCLSTFRGQPSRAPNIWETPMHLSVFTTFPPKTWLWSSNIFYKSTPVIFTETILT